MLVIAVGAAIPFAGAALARRAAPAASAGVTRVRIKLSPNPAVAGGATEISGSVIGPGSAGVTVTIWRKRPSQHRFHLLYSTVTDSGGGYLVNAVPSAIRTTSKWYATAGGVRSRTATQRVQAVLTLAASDALPSPGERLVLSGRLTPSYGHRKVLLERLVNGHWHVVKRPWIRASSFSVAVHFNHSQALRVALRKDARNAFSTSPVLPVDVNPIHKIKHVVVIMQENRSFDSYFGTYSGADGIPGLAGNPGTLPCVPDPQTGGCDSPFHDPSDQNYGGPHAARYATADINGGRMNGFVGQAEAKSGCSPNSTDPNCAQCASQPSAQQSQCIDVMGYHDAREIPNYWNYAHNYVLQDHMFEPNASWSLPEHLYMVSEWSAFCTNPLKPGSCSNALNDPNQDTLQQYAGPNDGKPVYAWTDITYLLHKAGVSWGYYVFKGTEPDCESDSAMSCAPVKQAPQTAGIWNPLPSFTDVSQDGQLGNIQTLSNFYGAAASGNLPAVSWVIPNGTVSEHPPGGLVSAGQTYVTGLINAIMNSPDWGSTAIFLSWDDWGGFYDHVMPPKIDANGLGLRVPGLLISPYAKQGYIDHHILSHDAYNKFIEDDFLGGQRLNPATDGRPDPRPDVREANSLLGNLVSEFNFSQTPRAPVLLPTHPAPGPASTPSAR